MQQSYIMIYSPTSLFALSDLCLSKKAFQVSVDENNFSSPNGMLKNTVHGILCTASGQSTIG